MKAFGSVIIACLSILLAANFFLSCNKRPCGAPYVEHYQEVPDFRGFDADLNAKITYTYGAVPGVRIHGDSATLSAIGYHVTGGILVLRYKKPNTVHARPVTVILTSPALKTVSVAGSGSLVMPVLSAPELTVKMAGSSNVVIGSLEAGRASVSVLGSGNFIMESGTVQQQTVSAAGSGYADMSNCDITAAAVSISGSGDVYSRKQTDVQLQQTGSGRLIRKE